MFGRYGVYPSWSRFNDNSIMTQVVANKNNGIDVDKWEYFARDCLMLGIRNNFDHIRIMNFVRVCDVEGKKQLCTRDKVTSLFPGLHRVLWLNVLRQYFKYTCVERLYRSNRHGHVLLQEMETLYDMFSIRRSLHHRAYKHRVVSAVDIM